MNILRKAFQKIWYCEFRHRAEPLPVCFPSGELEFEFSGSEKTPHIVLWCHGGTVGMAPTSTDTRVKVVMKNPPIAMTFLQVPDECLMDGVYSEGRKLTLGGSTTALVFDGDREIVTYASRWRVRIDSLRKLLGMNRDEDY